LPVVRQGLPPTTMAAIGTALFLIIALLLFLLFRR
jgi:hypothetical protein